MSMTETSPVVDLKFVDVPEIGGVSLWGALHDIPFRRSFEHDSFGAYVIRKGGMKVVELCLDEVQKWHHGVRPQGLFFNNKTEQNLHTDTGSVRRSNELTVHYTRTGCAEAVILVGSHIYPTPEESEYGDGLYDATKLLFEEGRLDTSLVSEPKVALSMILDEGDVLLFDHAQPHAFQSITDDRQSRAYW